MAEFIPKCDRNYKFTDEKNSNKPQAGYPQRKVHHNQIATNQWGKGEVGKTARGKKHTTYRGMMIRI